MKSEEDVDYSVKTLPDSDVKYFLADDIESAGFEDHENVPVVLEAEDGLYKGYYPGEVDPGLVGELIDELEKPAHVHRDGEGWEQLKNRILEEKRDEVTGANRSSGKTGLSVRDAYTKPYGTDNGKDELRNSSLQAGKRMNHRF